MRRHISRAFLPLILAAAALAVGQPALAADKNALDPKVRAKSASAGEIARELGTAGAVRVIVELDAGTVDVGGKASLERAMRDPARRAGAKARVRASLSGFLSSKVIRQKGAPGRPERRAAVTRFTTVPAFAAVVDQAELESLARDPRVVAVNYDVPVVRHLDLALPLNGMPAVHAAGGTGDGVAVAVIDDGVQRDHPFIGVSRIVTAAEACFLDTFDCPNGSNEQIGAGAAAAAAGASHGTHVAGIVLGNRPSGSPLKGNAPDARLVPINIFGPNGSTSFSTIQRAFEYVDDLVYASGGTNPHRIASVNMSVGGGSSAGTCDTGFPGDGMKPVVDHLRAKGVLIAVSAGNSSSRSAMSYPACISSIVSVAATSRTGVVASYTNISPSTDLFAPGGDFSTGCVVSSVPTNSFAAFCGTSMASPMVAGAIAAIRELVPDASADAIEAALKSTGTPTADSRSGGTLTKPRMRADLALAALQASSPTPPSPTPDPPPVNDAFASATEIGANTMASRLSGTNVAATLESGEAAPVAGASASVWWRWTPAYDRRVVVDTSGSAVDTVLAVYSGASSVSSRGTTEGLSDDATGLGTASSVSFVARAGTTYHILVAGKGSSPTGALALNLASTPTNDNFADAQVVDVNFARLKKSVKTAGAVANGSNVGATFEAGEPAHARITSATKSVWYRLNLPQGTRVTIDTAGSSFDTVLAAYTPVSGTTLMTLAANDDATGLGLASRITFKVPSRQAIFVAVAGYGGAEGDIRLNVSR